MKEQFDDPQPTEGGEMSEELFEYCECGKDYDECKCRSRECECGQHMSREFDEEWYPCCADCAYKRLSIATARVRQLEEENERLKKQMQSFLDFAENKDTRYKVISGTQHDGSDADVEVCCACGYADGHEARCIVEVLDEMDRLLEDAEQVESQRDSLQSQRDELERVVGMAEEWLTKIAADNADQDGDGVKLTMFKMANRHVTSVALHFIRQARERLGLPSSQARAALGKGAVDSAPQSAHTPNKEKT